MNRIMTTKVKNGAFILPRQFSSWRERELVVYMEPDRIIVQPLDAEWDRYEEKIKKGRQSISPRLIDEAVRWAKKQTR